jgi:Type II secretion system (T2SS), protein E, N-terminal domain
MPRRRPGRSSNTVWRKRPGETLRWRKTEHSYPHRGALLIHKRPLGEILVASGVLTAPLLRDALAVLPPGMRLGEHLVARGLLTEDALYQALSLQQGLPLTHLELEQIPLRVGHALPGLVARAWRVLPFQIAEGSLFLAGPDLPSPALAAAMRPFTALEIRFHLLAPSEYTKLADALL